MKTFELPAWLARWVARVTCSRCACRFRAQDLTQFGICPGDRRDTRGNGRCFFHATCSSCGFRSIILANNASSLREVVARSHRDYQRADRRRHARRVRGPGQSAAAAAGGGAPRLTGRDVDDVRRLLDRSQTHDDFLRSLGMSQEEIDRHKRGSGPGSGHDNGRGPGPGPGNDIGPGNDTGPGNAPSGDNT